MDIQNHTGVSRLFKAQKLLYGADLRWTVVTCCLLRKVTPMTYGKQLFLLNLNRLDLAQLSLFYRSFLKHGSSSLERGALVQQPLAEGKILVPESVCLRDAGVTVQAHLRSVSGWRTVDALQRETGVRSLRLMGKALEE